MKQDQRKTMNPSDKSSEIENNENPIDSNLDTSKVQTLEIPLRCKTQIIEIKNLITCYDGNVAYFVNNDGEPCDYAGEKLLKFGKIEKQVLNKREIQMTKNILINIFSHYA